MCSPPVKSRMRALLFWTIGADTQYAAFHSTGEGEGDGMLRVRECP